jgi:hypothetical protein
MNQKFERIEKHLYLRQYQTAGGEWSTLYYARFKDWKGRQRAFPLGSELKTAREELTIFEARNIRREDFDGDKIRGMTLFSWIERFEQGKASKRSLSKDKESAPRSRHTLATALLRTSRRRRLKPINRNG